MSIMRVLIYFMLSIILLGINTVLADDKIMLNIGGGCGVFTNRIIHEQVPQPEIPPINYATQTEDNYNAFVEMFYRINKNFEVGAGLNYLFGNYDLRFMPLKVKTEFIMPFIAAKYNFSLWDVDVYAKTSFGYGLGKVEVNYIRYWDDSSYEANGIGIIPCMGKSFAFSSLTTLNLEFGYRYIETSKLHNSNDVYFYDNILDFSGPFVQSSFSFRL